LELVEFLADLRQDLSRAQKQAAAQAQAAVAAGSEVLWMGWKK
jgi:hypothetical protein